MTVPDIEEVGKRGLSQLASLIKKPTESVIAITKEGKEWKVLVDALERKVVPPTQDMMGRYELKFSETGKLLGYRQVMLRRRSDRLDKEEK